MTDAIPTASPAELVATACVRYSTTVGDLMGPLRTRWLTKARREIAVSLHAQGMGLKDIGRILGRHHTSVMALLGMRERPKKRGRKRA